MSDHLKKIQPTLKIKSILVILLALTMFHTNVLGSDQAVASSNKLNESITKDGLLIDLNKLETFQENCRISMVFNNKSQHFFENFYMDLAFFAANGVIAERITVDAAPLRHRKMTIKEFDVPQLDCQQIDRVLLNTISRCESKTNHSSDCMSMIKLKSNSQTEFIM